MLSYKEALQQSKFVFCLKCDKLFKMSEHLCMAVGDKEGWFKFVSCFFVYFHRLTIFKLSCSWLVLFNPSLFFLHTSNKRERLHYWSIPYGLSSLWRYILATSIPENTPSLIQLPSYVRVRKNR